MTTAVASVTDQQARDETRFDIESQGEDLVKVTIHRGDGQTIVYTVPTGPIEVEDETP